jgi:DNA-binding transcriptional LysR family regulator
MMRAGSREKSSSRTAATSRSAARELAGRHPQRPAERLDAGGAEAATPVVTVATPEHLQRHGEPRSPSDLDGRECITFVTGGAARPWRFKGKFGEIVHQPRGRLRTNDAEQIRAAVLAGLGLAHTPGWLFTREIASGEVRRILRKFERDPLLISAVRPGGRLATKVRVFVDYMAEVFAAEPSLTLDQRGRKRHGTVAPVAEEK